MSQIAEKKVHFAPLLHQQRAIDRLLREGRFRNVTEFMRRAIEHYLDRMGRPTLSEQARQMAEDFASARSAGDLGAQLQAESMESDEQW